LTKLEYILLLTDIWRLLGGQLDNLNYYFYSHHYLFHY